jgi:REP element-mobilizing transposase RayT
MSRWKVIPEVKYHFVTTTVVEWQYIFTTIPCFEIMIESLKYCIKNKGLHLHGYVIMPNHAHYILSTDDRKNLSDVMRDFGTYTSRHLSDLLEQEGRFDVLESFQTAAKADGRGNEYKVWQDDFHPIALESEHFFVQKLNYLHDNPVRKGYVDQPEQWRYSSARNYVLDDDSVIVVEKLI